MRINIVWHVNALHLGAVLRIGQYSSGHNASLDDFLIMINIMQEHIECFNALDSAVRELAPFISRQYSRHHIKWNQALSTCCFAIHVKGNANSAKQEFGF